MPIIFARTRSELKKLLIILGTIFIAIVVILAFLFNPTLQSLPYETRFLAGSFLTLIDIVVGILGLIYNRPSEKRRIAEDKLKVYGQLSAIVSKIERDSDKPGIMMRRITRGPVLFRVSDNIFKELENIVQTNRYLLEDSTWKAWEEHAKGSIIYYGHGSPLYDLDLETFNADVKKHFEFLKKKGV